MCFHGFIIIIVLIECQAKSYRFFILLPKGQKKDPHSRSHAGQLKVRSSAINRFELLPIPSGIVAPHVKAPLPPFPDSHAVTLKTSSEVAVGVEGKRLTADFTEAPLGTGHLIRSQEKASRRIRHRRRRDR